LLVVIVGEGSKKRETTDPHGGIPTGLQTQRLMCNTHSSQIVIVDSIQSHTSLALLCTQQSAHHPFCAHTHNLSAAMTAAAAGGSHAFGCKVGHTMIRMAHIVHQQPRSLAFVNDDIVVIIQLMQRESQIIKHIATTQTHDKRIKFDR